jgi:amidase
MRKRALVPVALILVSCSTSEAREADPPFDVVEATIPEMQRAMEEGRLTSRELVTLYLARMATYEDRINAVLAVNPNALADADALDRERAEGRVRGPLHGIPVALKDNIHTTDMPTTGGALAFAGFTPPYDATLTKNLRDAGAVIIAKTGLTELANWVAGGPTPMPGNYTAVGGFAFNPYDPRRDPRPETGDGRPALNTAGSSSGTGTAASFWAGNVGTDTGGSILGPSNANGLVGIRPTTGRISRWGVIPISGDQDTAGPMARTVTDVAIMMGALESPAPDPNDAATSICTPPPGRDYTAFLNAGALQGARIGIPRAFYYDSIPVPGDARRKIGGIGAPQRALLEETIATLTAQGAIVVDPANIPSVMDADPKQSLAMIDYCDGLDDGRGQDDDCSARLKYGFKRDYNAWLATLGDKAPVKTLTEHREWNLAHQKLGAIRFGQARFDISDEMDMERDKARYEADRARDLDMSRTRGLDAVIAEHQLDALLFPSGAASGISSKAGYPTITVPIGMVPNEPAQAFPEGFNAKPAPYAAYLIGPSCSEPRLIELAYALEQATKKRVPPPDMP